MSIRGSAVYLMLALGLSTVSSAATIRVPEDYPAIRLALANSVPGDSVCVAPGTYFEWNLELPPSVLLYSPGFASARINALHQGKHFMLNRADASYQIEGFELVGGSANSGGSIEAGCLHSALTIKRCTFQDNSATNAGGAIFYYGSGSSLRIETSRFCNNHADGNAGAIWIDGQISGSTIYIDSCTFTGNSTRDLDGGALFFASRIDGNFRNVTIRNNLSGGSGGGFYSRGYCSLQFYGCLLAENVGHTGDDFRITETNVQVHESDFAGGRNEIDQSSSLALICCAFYAGADPTTWGPNVFVYDDGCSPTGIDPGDVAPTYPKLSTYPNPFNPRTTLRFTLPAAGRATVSIYDVRGELVAKLLDAALNGGPQSIDWNGRDVYGALLPSGTY